jgi:hypothetical protein
VPLHQHARRSYYKIIIEKTIGVALTQFDFTGLGDFSITAPATGVVVREFDGGRTAST